MTEIKMRYGFPLFSKPSSLVSLGTHQNIVISDIWAFWDYVIKKASKNRTQEHFLNSLLEQARHFYVTAEASPVKSQPLLYYYSFLNFAKIIISLSDSHARRKKYRHGMHETHNNIFAHSTVTKQAQSTDPNDVQVAHELVSVFDPGIATGKLELNVRKLLTHCVGVHRPYSEIYSKPEVFYKIKDHKLYKNGKELVFKAELDCSASNVPSLTARGYTVVNEDGIYSYIEKLTMSTYAPTRKDYADLSAAIRSKGIWYFVGNIGYRMYLSNSAADRYSQESIIYMVMFYLGSITRYHPYMFDELFSDKEQWLMSEFLNTQPKQFLYLATARILGQNVIKAYASF